MRRRALRNNHRKGRVQKMTRVYFFRLVTAGALMLFSTVSILTAEAPTPTAVAEFNDYVGQVETRLAQEHRSAEGFLPSADRAQVKNGEVVLEHLTPDS